MNAERQFGPYRLVRQIAVGGMAEIYLAKTRGIAGFEKYVALKMIHPNFSTDEQFIEMLIDEAKISVQLQHANVAQTFDLGRVGDTYYITIEYVDGADLYKLLRRGSENDIEMPVDVAAFIAKEVANGLDYAHRKRDHSGNPMGIVHRDVSPQNVLIAHTGEVKLVDFGIAKATMKVRQTAVGVIKGKYYYMSPEQAWGDPVDHRTDIFSVGILLYESLTGQMLYLEEDLHRLLDMVRKAQIAPPSTLRKGIPPQLERIVMNALQKRREDRYQSAGDMSTDLERFLHAYSPVFTPSKLGSFFSRVLDDQPPPPTITAVQDERYEPSMVTMRLEASDLIRERSELIDENSVIFRVAELSPGKKKVAPPPTPTPPAPSRAPRSAKDPTRQISSRPPPDPYSVLDHIEEQTMVSAPPGFGGGGEGGSESDGESDGEPTINVPHGTGAAGNMARPSSAPRSDFPDGGDFEPTLIGSPFDSPPGAAGDEVDDEAQTFRRDAPRQLEEMLKRQAAQRQQNTAPAAAAQRPASPVKKKGGPSHPALSAKTPQPAVSALGGGRRPRKTPAEPAPGVASPAGSVLSAIVGQGDVPMTPVRRDAPEPAGGRTHVPAPSYPVHPGSGPYHAQPGPGAPPGSTPYPVQPGPGQNPMGPPPGFGSPPGMGVPGPMGLPGSGPYPYAVPGPGSGPIPYPMPGGQPGYPVMQGYPGQGYPGQGSYPLPGGMGPATFTKQLQALELEEIPQAYKLARPERRWVLPVVLASICITLGVIIGVVLFTTDDSVPEKTVIRITSIPGGATVKVGEIRLAGATPTEWNEAKPGAPYDVTVERKGYKTETRSITVPAEGIEIPFILDRELVTLDVSSEPLGAEIRLDGKVKGTTPTTLSGLDVKQARKLELRLDGYQPYVENLDWGDEVKLDRNIVLEKPPRSR